jgi:chondroitin 4-sulfotransferase 11
MIVSHSLRAIFISNPKTGSKSVEAALAQFQDEPSLDNITRVGLYTQGHIPAYELRGLLGDSIWDAYFKFAFVRNPWDWFVSQHFYNLQKREIPHHVDGPLSIQEILRSYRFLRSYRGAQWVDPACQNAFVCDEGGQILVDFIGHFEYLLEDFMITQSIIGCQADLLHVNASTHRHYEEYYDHETRELIRQLYRRDIELFDYDF